MAATGADGYSSSLIKGFCRDKGDKEEEKGRLVVKTDSSSLLYRAARCTDKVFDEVTDQSKSSSDRTGQGLSSDSVGMARIFRCLDVVL